MDDRKMVELARDPAAVRRIAKSLIKYFEPKYDEDALKFLTRLTKYGEDGFNFLTGPQREFLFALMTQGESRRQIFGGYRAYTLLTELWALRLDFPENEEAEEFLREMIELGPDVSLTDGQWRYLLHIARSYDHIHHWVAA